MLVSWILPKKQNEKFDLENYDTSGWLVFVRFLEELNTKKSFRNQLTFSNTLNLATISDASIISPYFNSQ